MSGDNSSSDQGPPRASDSSDSALPEPSRTWARQMPEDPTMSFNPHMPDDLTDSDLPYGFDELRRMRDDEADTVGRWRVEYPETENEETSIGHPDDDSRSDTHVNSGDATEIGDPNDSSSSNTSGSTEVRGVPHLSGTGGTGIGFSPDDDAPAAYRFIRIIGQGGFGEIWEVEQTSLRRIVAIKRLRQDLATKAMDPDRAFLFDHFFRHEAQTAAYLEHPNILPVHDLGLDEKGHPLMSMKRLRGRQWSDLIHEEFDTLPVETYLAKHLQILRSICQAVAFAHSRGIIHRDIKPSQVMVGDYGEVVLMDWGLAVLFDEAALQRSEASVNIEVGPTLMIAANPAGTAAYMAPEQTETTADNLGPWTDVYLLGGTLYFLLTGIQPHTGKDKLEVFNAASLGIVTPVETAAEGRDVPNDLRLLAEQALRPDFRQRIQTVTEFLMHIDNYLSGASKKIESIDLTQDAAERLEKPPLEYRVLGEVLSMCDRASGLWPQNPDAERLSQRALEMYSKVALENNDLRMARIQAERLPRSNERASLMMAIERAEGVARRRENQRRLSLGLLAILFTFSVLTALLAYVQKERAQLASQQESQFREQADKSRADAEAALIEVRQQTEEAKRQTLLAAREHYYSSVGYAAASIREASVRRAVDLLRACAPEMRGWEWKYLYRMLNLHDRIYPLGAPILVARYSYDGNKIIIAGEQAAALVVDRDSGTSIALRGLTDKLYHAAFTRDGKVLATASKNGHAQLWDTATGRNLRTFPPHQSFVNFISFSQDEKRLAEASSDGSLRIYDIDTTAVVEIVTDNPNTNVVASVKFHPSGNTILATARDRRLTTYDAFTGKRLHFLPLGSRLGGSCVDVDPAGRRAVVSSWDGSVRLVDLQTSDVTLLTMHTDSVFRTFFSPDGKFVITCGHDNTVGLWDANTGTLLRRIMGPEQKVWSGDISIAKGTLLTGSSDGFAREYKMSNLDDTISTASMEVARKAFRTAERVILFNSNDTSYYRDDDLWENDDGFNLVTAGRHDFLVIPSSSYFSPDGKLRILRFSYGEVIDTQTSTVVHHLNAQQVRHVAFSPDKKYAMVCEPVPTLYSLPEWKKIRTYNQNPVGASAAEFSPDSKTVAIGFLPGRYRTQLNLFDLESTTPIFAFPGNQQVIDLITFSRDGTMMAADNLNEYRVGIYDVKNGKEISVLRGHSDLVVTFDFGADGSRIVTGGHDDTVRVWETRTGREVLLMPRGSEGNPLSVKFSRDGMKIFAPYSDGSVSVFDATPPTAPTSKF